MIKGLTHSADGMLNKITKYRGKISTGYAPGEGPNKQNHPVACGFFRMLKEIVRTERVGTTQQIAHIKQWILNDKVQKNLENVTGKENKTPRAIKIVFLLKTPMEMWESKLGMYTKRDGLVCTSSGEGTNARLLQFNPEGEREWIDREFDGKKGCLFKECPDFKAKQCKPIGLLKCFPEVDLAPNPYRFETRSINTIIGIESALQDAWTLVNAAHVIKEREAGKTLPFEGLFGSKFCLMHKKIKSGGRDVFITDLMPTQEFTDVVMAPIKRGLELRRKNAALTGSAGSVSLLEKAGSGLLTSGDDDVEEGVSVDLTDEKEIAVNFGTPGEEEVVGDSEGNKKDDYPTKSASETLLNDSGESPEK